MNPSDSKKLKEIEKQVGRSWDCSVSNHLVEWLISKVAEQDREIERLKGMVNAAVDQREEMRSFANDHLNKRGEAEDRAEKAGAQLKDAEYRWQRER